MPGLSYDTPLRPCPYRGGRGHLEIPGFTDPLRKPPRSSYYWREREPNREGAMAEFEAGNLVQLKSGGPVMTVEKVVTDGWSGSRSSPLYECSWFRGATRNKESFEEAALVEADEDEGGSG